MQSKSHSKWRDLGKGFAAEIKKPPRNIPFIEARGYLCHELTYLLGGCVTFCETPTMKFVMRALEYFIPIAPICRWLPPPNSTLEQIGHHAETSVYRFKPEVDATVVFFVNYKPEPPAAGPYLPALFNVPQLDSFKFLRPPFGNRDEIEHVFRGGMVGRFTPIPMTEGARESMAINQVEMNRAMWEEFCKD
jgi:hypothetical protein